MKMSEEFPSKYLKAADLGGREIKVIMANCEREEFTENGKHTMKPVLYFRDKTKGVVLNKTNSSVIADFYGDDSEDWVGQPLILFSVMVDFQGKVGPAIRCRVPTAKDSRPVREDPISSGPPPGEPPHRGAGALNDDIPF